MKILSCYVHTYRQTDEWTQQHKQTLIKNVNTLTNRNNNVMIIKEPYYCRLHQNYIGTQGYNNIMITDF